MTSAIARARASTTITAGHAHAAHLDHTGTSARVRKSAGTARARAIAMVERVDSVYRRMKLKVESEATLAATVTPAQLIHSANEVGMGYVAASKGSRRLTCASSALPGMLDLRRRQDSHSELLSPFA
jgi:hypothetical protein